jgi:acetyl esterase
MPLDPQLAGLLQLLDAPGVPKIHAGNPEAGRAAMRAMSYDLVTPETRVPVGSVEELTLAHGLAARLYRPEVAGPTPTVVYLHGGGFVIGDLDTHDQTCRRLCRDAEATVLSVDYRLAPEHPFPAGVEDALAAVRWAAEHLADLGDGTLSVGGDSAGANLAAVVAQAVPQLLTAQILIYPSTDPLGDYPSRQGNATGYFLDRPTMEWFARHYVGGVELDPTDARLVPMVGDVSGGPRAVVATAELDPLRDEGEAYAAKLAAAGVPVDLIRFDGLIHGFADMGAWSAACADAVTDLNHRIRKAIHL